MLVLFVIFKVLVIVAGFSTIDVLFDKPEISNNKLNFYWNSPTFQCRSHKIYFLNITKDFGILQNNNDDFRGDQISILYDPGYFPALLKNSSSSVFFYRNGGVPQNGNIDQHLEIFKNHVNELIPNYDNDGLAIIDFESWRPIFRQNFGVLSPYKDISKKIVKKEHPFWPELMVEYEAKSRFEISGRIFMEETLKLGKKMRPQAKWGYYAYPYCFNMNGQKKYPYCPSPVPKENDETLWLFESSDILYPSLYLSQKRLNQQERQQLIKGRIDETKRIANKIKNKPKIIPYFWYKYQDTDEYLTSEDLYTSFKLLKTLNVDGIILWGSSKDVNTKNKCNQLFDFMNNVLGPIIRTLK